MKVKKKDCYRVLLTEVLPYEVPIWFSNKGLYHYYKYEQPKHNAPILVNCIFKIEAKHIFSPYRYKIRKNLTGIRILSIIHPLKQYDYVSFYEKYDQLILSFCNRSPVSIRYPSRVASNFFDSRIKKKAKEFLGMGVEVDTDGFAEQERFSSSYFSYSHFGFLYKFFDSYQFNTLEKKFNLICRFDIGNCFNSIYTHSIAWSTKSKDIVKETLDYHSFELTFDKKMQNAKARETNGIVIGPEVSRIFAEIILQKIDLDIISEVENTLDLKHNVDYSMRRYIDDYFVFTNTQKNADKIREIAEEVLTKFNFSLNPSKTTTFRIPYVSEISTGKTELNSILDTLNAQMDKIISTPEAESIVIKPSDMANKIIHQIKSVVVRCNIEIDKISTFILTRFRGIIFKFLRELNTVELSDVKRERFANFAFMLFDVFFYFFCVDIRPRSTYILSQIISKTTSSSILTNDNILKEIIYKKISDEINISIGKLTTNECDYGLELINMLYIQKQLGSEYIYSIDKYIKLTRFDNSIDNNRLSYFQIISALMYFGNDMQYITIKNKLCDYVVSIYENNKSVILHADGFCLMLDFLSCPYVDFSYKDKVALSVFSYFKKTPDLATRRESINYINKREWFTSWKDMLSLDALLEKFELNPCY